jgi:hypothetical protein
MSGTAGGLVTATGECRGGACPRPYTLALSSEGFFAEFVLRYQILPLHFVQGQNDIFVLSLRGAERRSNLVGMGLPRTFQVLAMTKGEVPGKSVNIM